ncbi:MAG: site-specific DNA-methyltransferase [Patescibacteria group bacterium]
MPKSSSPTPGKRKIDHYEHAKAMRLNNPPVGLVTPETDRESGKKTYAYDPHLDPTLQWAGKAERMSFEVPTVSLHVHERIDPHTIIETVRKQNGGNGNGDAPRQLPLFATPAENPPLREAIEFYKHPHGWSNRLIAGDSLLVMNSLLEKEGLAGQVQMAYIDPPYGVKYKSNFQPFVDRRDVADTDKDEDLAQEPEIIRAFRDTWELGIHSYLSYLRDRLLLVKELLHEGGSCFIQIGNDNVHLVRILMDEVFGSKNFVVMIAIQKTGSQTGAFLQSNCDYLLWYTRDRTIAESCYKQLFLQRKLRGAGGTGYTMVELSDGTDRSLTEDEIADLRQLPEGARIWSAYPLTSDGYRPTTTVPFEFDGRTYHPGKNRHWGITVEELNEVAKRGRIVALEGQIRLKRYFDDFPVIPLASYWDDLGGATNRIYVVQTNQTVIQRCVLMTTSPGDLVLDPTCGSGTTAYVAEQWGRRWITCDTSRVAITLAKQRLMTASYEYYELAHPEEGVASGFKYRTVPHVTLKSIANNEPPVQETLYDQPLVDNKRIRVTGPFTVEAVPAPMVKSLAEISGEAAAAAEIPADHSVAHTGETLRQAEWRDELFKCGIRGKNGQRILFSRVEPLAGTRWLHADAETKPNDLGADSVRERQATYQAERAVISFGPEHAALEQRQVALAIEEAQRLVPRPKLIIFAAFQFDPEAAKDIDETEWPGVTLLKVQMNTDLLTDDLKKKRASNESFWLIGQPDVHLRRIESGEHKGMYQVEVLGFDYYNTKTGMIESGDPGRIAMWMLDPDYDGRSLFPRQVFFPMAGDNEGWAKIARNLRAEIDEELIEAYRGTVSLPFEAGKNGRAAVKIVDDRGIESLKVLEVS